MHPISRYLYQSLSVSGSDGEDATENVHRRGFMSYEDTEGLAKAVGPIKHAEGPIGYGFFFWPPILYNTTQTIRYRIYGRHRRKHTWPLPYPDPNQTIKPLTKNQCHPIL